MAMDVSKEAIPLIFEGSRSSFFMEFEPLRKRDVSSKSQTQFNPRRIVVSQKKGMCDKFKILTLNSTNLYVYKGKFPFLLDRNSIFQYTDRLRDLFTICILSWYMLVLQIIVTVHIY